MVVGIVYGTLILVVGIIIAALLISGKCVNINIKHISGCKDVKDYYPDPGKPAATPNNPNYTFVLDTDTLNKLTKEANKSVSVTPINMDGVIAEMNKVMGITPIDPSTQQKEDS